MCLGVAMNTKPGGKKEKKHVYLNLKYLYTAIANVSATEYECQHVRIVESDRYRRSRYR